MSLEIVDDVLLFADGKQPRQGGDEGAISPDLPNGCTFFPLSNLQLHALSCLVLGRLYSDPSFHAFS